MHETNATDKKQHILDTAEALFSRNGFDATSTREIAEAAAVNVAMISYYFGSKENLLVAIIERFSKEIQTRIQSAYDSEVHPVKRMRTITDTYLSYSFDHPDPIMIAHRELGVSMRPTLQTTIQDTYNHVREMVSSTIIEGQELGLYRQVDVPLLIQGIGSMVDSMTIELHTYKRANIDLCAFNLVDIGDPEGRVKVKEFIKDMIERYLKKN
jgi:AcrR family transcriptional regulator